MKAKLTSNNGAVNYGSIDDIVVERTSGTKSPVPDPPVFYGMERRHWLLFGFVGIVALVLSLSVTLTVTRSYHREVHQVRTELQQELEQELHNLESFIESSPSTTAAATSITSTTAGLPLDPREHAKRLLELVPLVDG